MNGLKNIINPVLRRALVSLMRKQRIVYAELKSIEEEKQWRDYKPDYGLRCQKYQKVESKSLDNKICRDPSIREKEWYDYRP
jgi:hypothetical protein